MRDRKSIDAVSEQQVLLGDTCVMLSPLSC